MIKELGTLMMLGSLAVHGPSVVGQTNAPEANSLTAYVEAANKGDYQPDPIVTTVANLCPVIMQAAKGQDNPYGGQMNAACAMLQAAEAPGSEDLLAMVGG